MVPITRVWGVVGAIGVLLTACAEPPVKPLPSDLRRSITTVSGDVSGVKNSDTSEIGARGSAEGGQRGAAQGAAAMMRSGTLGGLLLAPVGAAVGGAKGATDAQSEQVVDDVRSELRLAMQDVDFGEDLKSRLAASRWADSLTVAGITLGAASAAQQSATSGANGSDAHIVALEYRVLIYHPRHVNPRIAIIAQVVAQIQSPDRKRMLHKATWTYCGEPYDFVEMAANKAALLRGQISRASEILAEAIPHDLFVSDKPRPVKGVCMDFTDLPGGRGTKAPTLPLY